MDVTSVTVAIPVSDLAASAAWYEAVLERAHEIEPVPGIVEYEVAGTWIQLVSGRSGSPGWVLRYGVGDLDRERQRIAGLGVNAGTIKTVPGVIRFFEFRDPDDNQLSAYQVLG